MEEKEVWEEHLPELGKKRKEDFVLRGAGSVRLNLGRFYNNDDYKKRRKKVLSKKLP